MAKYGRILGGLAAVGGGVCFLVLVGAGWAATRVMELRGTKAYEVSVEFLKQSSAIRAQVGEDASINPLVWGVVDSRVDGMGSATLTHVITSSKGVRLLTVELSKSQDVWSAVGASGVVSGTDAPFTVDAGPPVGLDSHDPGKSIEAVTRADEHYVNGDFVAAIAEYDQAVDLDPNNPAAWFGRGRAYGRRGDTVRAVSDLEQAVKLAPSNAAAWEALGWARLHSGDDSGALAALNRLLALRPGDPRALGMRADANSKLGHGAEAKADADAACKGGDAFACNLRQQLR
ncbi:MAG: tetratricopeptide repeat protein [Myxococcales bacterium]|nr:tetratricopeptide repeat protein [Myxococcales bacterium]